MSDKPIYPYPHEVPEGFTVQGWTMHKCNVMTPWDIHLGVSDLGFNLLTPCCRWIVTRRYDKRPMCDLCEKLVDYPAEVKFFFDVGELQSVLELLLQKQYGVFGAALEATRAVEFLGPLVEELRVNNRAAIDKMMDSRLDFNQSSGGGGGLSGE